MFWGGLTKILLFLLTFSVRHTFGDTNSPVSDKTQTVRLDITDPMSKLFNKEISFEGMIAPISLSTSATTNGPSNDKSVNIIASIWESATNQDDIKWYTGPALQTLKTKFSTVLLSYGSWKRLAASPLRYKENLPNLIIDYDTERQIDWEKEEQLLLTFAEDDYVTSGNVLAIPLPILGKDIEDFSIRIGSLLKFHIGCSLPLTTNWTSDAQLETAFENCVKINGNLYIFPMSFNFNDAQLEGYFYYTNIIHPALQNLKQARKKLLSKSSDVVVYIHLVTPSSQEVDKNYPTTVFCNDHVRKSNELNEAILKWAKRNNFTIILKNAFDSINQPHISSWMSALRPPYSIYSLTTGFSQLRTSQPEFVMRNYPENINGWKIDPCIPWIKLGESSNSNFLRSNHTGAVFTLEIRESAPISKEELQTMFQFLMHKFSVIELIATTPAEVSAFGEAMTLEFVDYVAKNNLTTQTKFFMNYNMKEGHEMPPQQLLVLNAKFREFQRNTLIFAEGVHVHYSEVEKQEQAGNRYSFATLLLTTKHTLKIGLVIREFCMDELQLAQINKTSRFHKAAQGVQYIVCTEIVDVESGDGMTELGTIFDTHLYIKKMLNREYPGLGLYFKLKLDIELGESLENMERYKRFLKHCQMFGEAYDIKYFLVEAFDIEKKSGRKSNGWWAVSDFTDLENAEVFTEKEALGQNLTTWRPQTRLSGTRRAKTDDDSNKNEFPVTLVISLFSGLTVLFLIFLSCSVILVLRYRKLQITAYLTAQEVLEFKTGTAVIAHLKSGEYLEAQNLKFDENFELSHGDFTLDSQHVLGSGQFGIVCKGTVNGCNAAIKIPNQNIGKETFKSVLGEVKILCHLGKHQHTVGFLGAYVQEIRNGKLYIATELCENGSLESYLRGKNGALFLSYSRYVNLGNKSPKELLLQDLYRFALEIAIGMEYITSKNVVHGDLATRNVLLDSNFVCKISDFGLSRKVYEYQKYRKTSQQPLPWKWMAYESLAMMEFTSMSDVWSYGVTVWEIFSLGHIPYAGKHWTPKFSEELRDGLRLPLPQFGSQEIYNKLMECWALDAGQRPTFSDIVRFLQNLQKTEYENVEI